MAELIEGLTSAVSRSDRATGLRYIEAPRGLIGLTLYRGRGADAVRSDLATPEEIYGALARTFSPSASPQLLAAAVGRVAPETSRRPGGDRSPTAGVEFVVADGPYSLTGKIGVDCDSGRLYVGAVNFKHGLERQRLCGGYVGPGLSDPRVCSIRY